MIELFCPLKPFKVNIELIPGIFNKSFVNEEAISSVFASEEPSFKSTDVNTEPQSSSGKNPDGMILNIKRSIATRTR